MAFTKILLLLIPLLQHDMVASQSLSDPTLANSLQKARNVSVDFPSGSHISITNPSTYTVQPKTEYPYHPTQYKPNTQPTNYMPPCWTQTPRPTQRTTTPPPTQRTTTPPPTQRTTTPPSTTYMPPCWTQTPRPTQRTTTPPPTTYMPPCWTQTPRPTQHTTTTSPKTYMPPCWTQTPRTTQHTTMPSPKTNMPPCWTQTTHTTQTIPQHTGYTAPPRTTQFPGLENFVCDRKDNFYSVPNECDTFIECKNNVPRKHFCPEGLVYKPSTIWPAYPCVMSSEYQCLNGSITQPARPSGQCPHQDGYYSLPGSDCSQYLVCEKGKATLMNCPEGTVFNEDISACDWPINVPNCLPNVLADFSCPADDTESEVIYKYRYHNSCKMFVACERGEPRLLSCGAGLRFNSDKLECIDENSVSDCVDP